MSRRALLAVLCPVVAIALVFFAAKRNKTGKPITPGPDTTVIDGPLDAAGLIDYETALNTRFRGTSTPDTNAVVLLLQAIGPQPEGSPLHPDVYRWLGTTAPPDEGSYLVRSAAFFAYTFTGDIPEKIPIREAALRNSPWTSDEEPRYAEWIAANEKPLAVIAEAVKRPDFFHPLVVRTTTGKRGPLVGALTFQRPDHIQLASARDAFGTHVAGMMPLVQRCREIAAVLGMRVMLRCGEKRYDEAWQDVMTIRRLARLIGKGGTLIESLVGYDIESVACKSALRMLETTKPTATPALAWRHELAALPPFPSLADKVDVSVRFTFLDVCQFVRRDGAKALYDLLGRTPPDEPSDDLAASLRRLDWNKLLRTGNGWCDRLAAALRRPTRDERLAALTVFKAELKALPWEPVALDLSERLVTLLGRTADQASEAFDHHEMWSQSDLHALAQAARSADRKK